MGSNVLVLPVKPHVRKYIMVRLAPGERLADLDTQELVQALSERLRVEVLHAKPDERLLTEPSVLLPLVRTGNYDPGLRRYEAASYFLEQTYTRHAHAWMDHMRSTLRLGITAVMYNWRARYGITEEDQPYETARRAYARHRERRGDMLPHGGLRVRSELLRS